MHVVLIHSEPPRDEDVVAEILRDEGYHIERLMAAELPAAPRGARDAEAEVPQGEPDVVMLMAGLDLAEPRALARAARLRWPRAGCLLVSSRRPLPTEWDRSEFPDVLVMPFGLDALFGALRRALRRAPS